MEKIHSADAVSAAFVARSDLDASVEVHGVYTVECRAPNGDLRWRETFDNLVTTVGRNALLDTFLSGSSYTASLALGLKGTGTAAAADTMASHAGWSEVGGTNAPAYSGTRKVPAFSAASAGSKTMSAAAAFTFTSGGTVAGCFLVSGGTTAQDNTTGTLYSAGDFASSRAVLTNDVLNVTYTASA